MTIQEWVDRQLAAAPELDDTKAARIACLIDAGGDGA